MLVSKLLPYPVSYVPLMVVFLLEVFRCCSLVIFYFRWMFVAVVPVLYVFGAGYVLVLV